MWSSRKEQFIPRTVDGNGNGLVEGVSISADESWDLSELVKLEVFGREALDWLGLDNLEFDVVGLGHCKNGR